MGKDFFVTCDFRWLRSCAADGEVMNTMVGEVSCRREKTEGVYTITCMHDTGERAAGVTERTFISVGAAGTFGIRRCQC